jgi:hypothetical protein
LRLAVFYELPGLYFGQQPIGNFLHFPGLKAKVTQTSFLELTPIIQKCEREQSDSGLFAASIRNLSMMLVKFLWSRIV